MLTILWHSGCGDSDHRPPVTPPGPDIARDTFVTPSELLLQEDSLTWSQRLEASSRSREEGKVPSDHSDPEENFRWDYNPVLRSTYIDYQLPSLLNEIFLRFWQLLVMLIWPISALVPWLKFYFWQEKYFCPYQMFKLQSFRNYNFCTK